MEAIKNIVYSVSIEGLWKDCKPIKFKCAKQFNFIIGKNGTGKTTVINLLAAILTADIERLAQFQFNRVEVSLIPHQGRGTKKRPTIIVTKTINDDQERSEIEYEFLNTHPEQISKKLKASQSDLITQWDSSSISRWSRGLLFKSDQNEIIRTLKSLISVSWLSVNRASTLISPDESRAQIPAIDLKLSELRNGLIKYLSQLAQQYSLKVIEFQKRTLLSVLTPENNFESILKQSSDINISKEREALISIFSMLNIDSKSTGQKIDRHLSNFKETINKVSKERAPDLNQIMTVYHALRAHELVQDYEKLEAEREKIFKPKSDFIQEINNLLEGRKKIYVNEKNEISFLNRDGSPLEIEKLSSGEKQLLIILGEALLKNLESVIYIADEPELSLHIIWQEAITSAISRINPKAQIIFATHSPDIVGGRTENIIDMETLNP